MSDMLFGIIVGVVIGLVSAYFLLQLMLSWLLRRSEERLEMLVKAIEQVTVNQIAARVEEEGGVFYVYNTRDGSFLAQGTTLAELRERIEARWPDATVHVTEGDASVLDKLKATTTDVVA